MTLFLQVEKRIPRFNFALGTKNTISSPVGKLNLQALLGSRMLEFRKASGCSRTYLRINHPLSWVLHGDEGCVVCVFPTKMV
jgi:hypothetical protein